MYPNWKGRSKTVTICRWHGNIYIDNPQDSIKEQLELINLFNKFSGYTQSIPKNLLCFYRLIMNYQKEK